MKDRALLYLSLTLSIAALVVGIAALRASRTVVQPKVYARSAGRASIKPNSVNSETIPSSKVKNEIDDALAETSYGGREAAFQRLDKSISTTDIPQALSFLAGRQDGVDTPLFSSLASRWGSKEPQAAMAWGNNLQDTNARTRALVGIVDGWASTSPKAAADYVATMVGDDVQDACIAKALGTWSFRDGPGAVQWVTQFVAKHPESKFTDKAVDSVIFWAQGQCPAAIADMLDATGNTNLVQKYGETVGVIWLNRDHDAASTWIKKSALSDEVKQRLLKQN